MDIPDSRPANVLARMLGGAVWSETVLAGARLWTVNSVAEDGGRSQLLPMEMAAVDLGFGTKAGQDGGVGWDGDGAMGFDFVGCRGESA